MNKLLLLSWLTLLPLSLSGDQIFFDYVDNDWPNSRYIVHGDGTVTDTETSLMWLQCLPNGTYTADSAYGTCSGGNSATVYYWEDALGYASTHVYASHSDWRIPNIKELESILAFDRLDPPLNSDIFIGLANHVTSGSSIIYYWSATIRPESTPRYANAVFVVEFDDGGFGFSTKQHNKTSIGVSKLYYTLVRTVE